MPSYLIDQPNVMGNFFAGQQAASQQRNAQEQNALLKMQQQYATQKAAMEQQSHGQDQQRALIEDLAKATQWVQSQPPEQQAQAWNQVIDTYKPVMGDMVEQYRDPQNIGPISAWAKQEQAKWSAPVAGVDPATGKPMYGQIDPATGKSRPVQGLAPTPPKPDKPDAPPDPRPIRQEFTTQAQPFVAVRDASRKVETATDSAAGDMSLVFGYMKMLDPGSTVREGEYALAEQARGVPDTVLNLYNKAARGERLSPAQRAQFKSEAKKVYAVAKRGYDQLKNQYRGIATRGGFKPEDVLVDYENDAPTAAAPAQSGWSIEPVP